MPLPPPVVHTDPTAQFVFERRGGAIIHARLSIWDDPGGPNQKRVDVLFFEDSLDAKETFTRTLPAGIYTLGISSTGGTGDAYGDLNLTTPASSGHRRLGEKR